VLGSFERFLGILIEHFAGCMPLWLAPEQVRVMPISEKTNAYAEQLTQRFRSECLRCGLDVSNEKIGAKIAKGHMDKLPVMIIVGPKEAESDAVNVRVHGQEGSATVGTEAFLGIIKRKIDDKDNDPAWK
jgi:threonyl-tRNA synthetase